MTIHTPDLSYKLSKERITIGEVFSFAMNFFSEIIVYTHEGQGSRRFLCDYSTARFQSSRDYIKRAQDALFFKSGSIDHLRRDNA